jgi:protease II
VACTDTGGSGVWDAGDDGFFYTRLDPNHRPSKVLFHTLGDSPENDRLIYEETDPGFFMDVGGTRSSEWIMIGINEVLQARDYHLMLVPLSKNPSEWESVLLDQRHPGELRRTHMGVQVIAAGHVLDAHLRAGQGGADQTLDFGDVSHATNISE